MPITPDHARGPLVRRPSVVRPNKPELGYVSSFRLSQVPDATLAGRMNAK